MNLIRLFYFIFLFATASFAFAAPSKGALSRQEKLFLSKLDEEFLEESDPEEWILFIKQFGKEKVAIQFPSQPALSAYEKKSVEDEVFVFSASEDGVNYALRIETKPQKIESVDRYWAPERDIVSPHYQLLRKSQKNGPHGLYIDVEYLDQSSDKNGKKNFKKRLIANAERFYVLCVESPILGQAENPDFFDSFHIIKPLE
jgi:hypothetical protein